MSLLMDFIYAIMGQTLQTLEFQCTFDLKKCIVDNALSNCPIPYLSANFKISTPVQKCYVISKEEYLVHRLYLYPNISRLLDIFQIMLTLLQSLSIYLV